MKTIGFIGQSNRDKSYLMMYLGKILSQGGHVSLMTKDQWLMPELATYEYSPTFLIGKIGPSVLASDYLLLEITNNCSLAIDLMVYVSGIERNTVEFNKKLFETAKVAPVEIYLFQNVLMDGKINEKYLCQRLDIDRKSQQVMCQYLNDNDLAVNIENGYNERIHMKDLSKGYKKLLLELTSSCSDASIKTSRRWLKSAERSK